MTPQQLRLAGVFASLWFLMDLIPLIDWIVSKFVP